MTARDWFGLFVRIVAFLIVLYGTYEILFAITQVLGVIETPIHPTSQYIVGGSVFVGFGAAIMRLADWITAFAYRPEPRRDERDPGGLA